jgi:uncharacterized membrane protein YhaH (DUF805 family)
MFGFEGRLGQQDFWIMTLIIWGVKIAGMVTLVAIAFAPLLAIGIAAEKNGGQVDDAAAFASLATFLPLIGVFVLMRLALMWPEMAVNSKRFHDRDQSGWLCLIFVGCGMLGWIPIFGLVFSLGSFIFWLVNLGILDGTPGSNRYGPSPRPEFGPDQVFA